MNQSNSNPFGGLNTEGLETSRDVLGGGGAIDSGVYTGTIKLAYAGKSKKGANSMTVHIDLSGREYRETLYVTNKQGKNFYEKNGKKSPLPGFTAANDLALLSTGVALNEQEIEEKVVKLWDFDAKAEVPTKVQAVTSMMGKPITVGVLKQVVDKTTLNEATGDYEPTGETREENIIDKVFHAETGKTVSEFTLRSDTADFQPRWDAKNTGTVRDRSTGTSGKSGAPSHVASSTHGRGSSKAAPKSLFG